MRRRALCGGLVVLSVAHLVGAQAPNGPLVVHTPAQVTESPARILVPHEHIPERKWMDAGQWRLLDFGDVVWLSEVRLTWAAPGAHPPRYRVEVADEEGEQWTVLHHATLPTTQPGKRVPRVEVLTVPPVFVRYLRVVGFWVQLPQIQSLVQVQCLGPATPNVP